MFINVNFINKHTIPCREHSLKDCKDEFVLMNCVSRFDWGQQNKGYWEREAMLSTGELICPFHSFNKKKKHHFNRYSLGSWKYKDLSKIISNWNTKEQCHAKEGP